MQIKNPLIVEGFLFLHKVERENIRYSHKSVSCATQIGRRVSSQSSPNDIR